MPSDLLKAQWLYVACLSVWLPYGLSRGYQLTQAEGYVGDSIEPHETTPHRRGGAHFTRTGGDWNLWRRDGDAWIWVKDGRHSAWVDMGERWESLDPLCFWGGRIGDANHVSIRYNGRA